MFLSIQNIQSKHHVYLIHGYAGLGLEMQKINHALHKAGFSSEIISYPSLVQDVDTVAHAIYQKIISDKPDTVSFVTHSMGALVARSIYQNIKPGDEFPYIDKMVMIAPPNKGTPIADFFIQSMLIKSLAGPNIANLTTDQETGASKYPIPKCDVGVILGIAKNQRGYNLFLEENNDGLILPKYAILGIEKDIAFVKASHTGILLLNKTSKLVISFLRNSSFLIK